MPNRVDSTLYIFNTASLLRLAEDKSHEVSASSTCGNCPEVKLLHSGNISL
jgi:hypothetical protein